jgi:hypothetical protein
MESVPDGWHDVRRYGLGTAQRYGGQRTSQRRQKVIFLALAYQSNRCTPHSLTCRGPSHPHRGVRAFVVAPSVEVLVSVGRPAIPSRGASQPWAWPRRRPPGAHHQRLRRLWLRY